MYLFWNRDIHRLYVARKEERRWFLTKIKRIERITEKKIITKSRKQNWKERSHMSISEEGLRILITTRSLQRRVKQKIE